MNTFRTLSSKRLWLNLVLIALLVLALVFGVLFWLSSYTLHGESVGVPDLRGSNYASLDEVLYSAELTYEVTDSIYSDEYPRGAVVHQNPSPGHRVKEGRTIYLTVNSLLPEMVSMPDLKGKSRRIAIPILEISGLVLENLSYKPDETCTDCVLDQLFEGEPIEAGTQIRKGEKVTLVLGQRSNELTKVPRMLGLSYEDAYSLLNAYSLNMGQILSCEGCLTAEDTVKAFVVNQFPASHEETTLGSFVDLMLTLDADKVANFEPDTNTTDYETEQDF